MLCGKSGKGICRVRSCDKPGSRRLPCEDGGGCNSEVRRLSRITWSFVHRAGTSEHYEGLIRHMVTGCMGGQCRSAVTVEERKMPRVACIFK